MNPSSVPSLLSLDTAPGSNAFLVVQLLTALAPRASRHVATDYSLLAVPVAQVWKCCGRGDDLC